MTARLRQPFLSLIFGLTGVGIALLGAALPAILHQGRFSDSQGGLLLLAIWTGSTSGALFARGNLGRIVSLGLALSAAGLFLMSSAQFPSLPFVYALYGLGLGMTMTAISTLRAGEVAVNKADLELNRLNLLWAIGAFCAPALAAHSLRLLSINGLFRILAVVFASAAAIALILSGSGAAQMDGKLSPKALPSAWAPLSLGLFAFAAVGLESAVGGWLTTYVERSTHGILTAVSANSAFWAGLLLSRAAHSLPGLQRLHTRNARFGHLGLTAVAAVLLLASPNGTLLPLAGLLCGLGLGPLYPYVLAVSLPRYRSTAVFVLAGVGASVVPWLTGVLSSRAGSLRLGFLVPVGTIALLIAVAVRMQIDSSSEPTNHGS